MQFASHEPTSISPPAADVDSTPGQSVLPSNASAEAGLKDHSTCNPPHDSHVSSEPFNNPPYDCQVTHDTLANSKHNISNTIKQGGMSRKQLRQLKSQMKHKSRPLGQKYAVVEAFSPPRVVPQVEKMVSRWTSNKAGISWARRLDPGRRMSWPASHRNFSYCVLHALMPGDGSI